MRLGLGFWIHVFKGTMSNEVPLVMITSQINGRDTTSIPLLQHPAFPTLPATLTPNTYKYPTALNLYTKPQILPQEESTR